MKRGPIISILLALLFIGGCQKGDGISFGKAGLNDWLPLRINEVTIEAQVAVSFQEKKNGLMYREELAPDNGMLFPYDRPQKVGFWMANTPLPLDIGFFDSQGILREIHRMVPYDMTRIQSRSDNIQFALEMNRGWFAENNLFPGSRLNLEDVSAALKKRGEEPAEYGL